MSDRIECVCGRTIEIEDDHEHEEEHLEHMPWSYELGKLGFIVLASVGELIRGASNHMVGLIQLKQARISNPAGTEDNSSGSGPGSGMLHEG